MNVLSHISSYLDARSDELRTVNMKIWENPELGFEEFIAHSTLTSFLAAQPGWRVTESAYGIATAFVAEYDSGKPGPVVNFNAEYDCLPGIGHACGHNLIATAGLAAGLSTAECIARFQLPGKVVVFGTPAEEEGGGKIKLLNAGAFSDHKVDVSLMCHPHNVRDNALATTAANFRVRVEYFGKQAHAAAAPWEGINALDGLLTAYTAISMLRQHCMPGDIIQGHITHGGARPNIIHEYAAGVFIVRAKRAGRLEELKKKVIACFDAGALGSGARVEYTYESAYRDHVPNWALGRNYREYFNMLLPPGNGRADQPSGIIVEQPILPPEMDIKDAFSNASTDQGDVSYALPSLHAVYQLISDFGPHTPAFTAAVGTLDAHARTLRVAKALAATAVDVLTKAEYLDEIVREWEREVGVLQK